MSHKKQLNLLVATIALMLIMIILNVIDWRLWIPPVIAAVGLFPTLLHKYLNSEED